MIKLKITKTISLIILNFTVAYSDIYQLKYCPSGELLYYYNCNSLPPVNVYSPLLCKSTQLNKDGFVYIVKHITPEAPPNDFSKLMQIEMKGSGNVSFWEMKSPGDLLLTNSQISEVPILFPYFTKKQYEIGEEWECSLPVPTAFLIDSIFGKPVAGHYVKVRQKFTKKIDILGYQCAEITYLFKDVLTVQNGITLEMKCKGASYFALNEGFIVSDVMEMEYNSLIEGEKRRITYTKKLRLVKEKKEGFK